MSETLQNLIKQGVKLTPMMKQYAEIKKQYPDMLLLFRMGDFYELFFEDASLAAKLLNITLTTRGKLGETPIPMSGIPHHAANNYIDRITSSGYKAAICEQIEDPKLAQGIVKRGVTQVVSPGIPFDLEKTAQRENYFIACAGKDEKNKNYPLVLVDFTTGSFIGQVLETEEELLEELKLYAPKELLTFLGQWDESPRLLDFCEHGEQLTTYLSADCFETKTSAPYLKTIIPNYGKDQTLKQNQSLLNPMAALSYYICSTQKLEDICHLHPFRVVNRQQTMSISHSTLVGLEIFPKNKNRYKESLLGFCDRTKSAVGARQLRELFRSPSQELEAITVRQGFIQSLIKDIPRLEEVRTELEDVRDIERILAKVSTGKATASDLINLANTINIEKALQKKLKNNPLLPKLKKVARETLLELSVDILKTLNDEVGASFDRGNLIKKGINKKRDKLARLKNNTAEELLSLEQKYREQTGITTLKVKSNNVNGYFIEVSKAQTEKVPNDFNRIQTLVNAERYLTEELKVFENEILLAKEKLERLEREIFQALIKRVAESAQSLLLVSQTIGLIDSFQSLAWLAYQEDFSRPNFNEKERCLKVKGAWHPLIKSVLRDQFVCHDIDLNEEKSFGLITGPNMAGKTTVMREMAIIQFLAQLGSFVPASHATLGLCDFLFSRLGASDDIIQGQSTFMVEMAETAEILRHATNRSLIVIDEIGRGTSTYDGLSIAWALVEYFILNLKSITLFSTHYHELIELVAGHEQAKNLTVETIQQNGQVKFLYRLIEQGATQSFGIHVAKLAGLPQEILERSQSILDKLEQTPSTSTNVHNISGSLLTEEQLSFFQLPMEAPKQRMEMPPLPENIQSIKKDLEDLDALNMTPMQALEKLIDLQSRV